MKFFYTLYNLILKLSLYCLYNFFSLTANSQRLFYDPGKDKYFLDSLKKVTKKFESKEDFNYLQELKYFNSCIALGEYYEKLFHKKILSSNKLAVHYYEKVTDFGTFPGDPHYYKAAALRNNLCRKLAAIFFTGDGVKRNRKVSVALALKGSSWYSWFSAYYSQKYFHCKCILLSSEKLIDYDKDSAFSFAFNPFIPKTNVASPLLDVQLTKIGNSFKRRHNKDTTLNVFIVSYIMASIRSQAYCTKLVQNIKTFLVERMSLAPEKIVTDCKVYSDNLSNVDIIFKKQ